MADGVEWLIIFHFQTCNLWDLYHWETNRTAWSVDVVSQMAFVLEMYTYSPVYFLYDIVDLVHILHGPNKQTFPTKRPNKTMSSASMHK